MESSERVQGLERLLENVGANGLRLLITKVDPDALAAAVHLKNILRRWKQVQSTIYYAGSTSPPQVQAAIKTFALGEVLKSIRDIPGDDIGSVFLIDSSRQNDDRVSKKFTPIGAIDHHQQSEMPDGSFLWYQPVGATTTIIQGLYGLLDKQPTEGTEWSRLATLGAAGIAVDTNHFTRGGWDKADVKAWSWFMSFATPAWYRSVVNFDRPLHFADLVSQAMDQRRWWVRDTTLFVNVELIDEEEDYCLAIIADELIQMLNFETVVVWAPVRGIGVQGSVRSDKRTEDVAKFLQRIASSTGSRNEDEAEAIVAGGFLQRVPRIALPDVGPVAEKTIEWFEACLCREFGLVPMVRSETGRRSPRSRNGH
jgi:nanoRNase/pAp phosphatase (c-di-AMP/oligoRNAs hydrolase)